VKLPIALPSHGIGKDVQALFGLGQHTLSLLTSELQREVTAVFPQGFGVAYAGPLVMDTHTSRTPYHAHLTPITPTRTSEEFLVADGRLLEVSFAMTKETAASLSRKLPLLRAVAKTILVSGEVA
jgi:hypothetical protein